jgi:hypothetical protein
VSISITESLLCNSLDIDLVDASLCTFTSSKFLMKTVEVNCAPQRKRKSKGIKTIALSALPLSDAINRLSEYINEYRSSHLVNS